MNTVALCRLKSVLVDAGFDGAPRVLKVLKEAGLLPAGTAGRGGVGSAQVTPRHAAICLFALCSLAWTDQIDCAVAAQRLAGFRFHSRNGRSEVSLQDVVAGELISIFGAANSPGAGAWRIGKYFVVREGGGLRLQFLAPDTPVGELLIHPQTRLSPGLIREVAELFRPAAAAVEAATVADMRA